MLFVFGICSGVGVGMLYSKPYCHRTCTLYLAWASAWVFLVEVCWYCYRSLQLASVGVLSFASALVSVVISISVVVLLLVCGFGHGHGSWFCHRYY